jgi:hypothetical protein
MENDRTICLVCAWRRDCNKKFSMGSATTRRCPDYVRDLTLLEPSSDKEKDNKE